jgi:outer membrane lipoprotein SlyB
MTRVVTGLFTSSAQAQNAIEALKTAGFTNDEIGVVIADRTQMPIEPEHDSTGLHVVRDLHTPVSATESHEATAAGGILGGTIGALMAATGALVIPGAGPFIAGGILATIAGGAIGALAGAFVGLGFTREEAEYYEREVQAGRTLVTVQADGRELEATSILVDWGAESEIPTASSAKASL